jgi:hypothetical protein
MEHTLPEQRKASPTEHRSLDQFELGDLAFNLTIGIDQGSSSKHLFFVPFEPLGEPLGCHTEFCVMVQSRKAQKLGLAWF